MQSATRAPHRALQLLQALKQQAALPLQRHLLPAQPLPLHPPAALLDAEFTSQQCAVVKHLLMCIGLTASSHDQPQVLQQDTWLYLQRQPQASEQVHLQRRAIMHDMHAA